VQLFAYGKVNVNISAPFEPICCGCKHDKHPGVEKFMFADVHPICFIWCFYDLFTLSSVYKWFLGRLQCKTLNLNQFFLNYVNYATVKMRVGNPLVIFYQACHSITSTTEITYEKSNETKK
jgi:hypothetical protein